MLVRVGVSCLILLAVAVSASAQQAPDGAAAFTRACALVPREGQTTAPDAGRAAAAARPKRSSTRSTNGRMQVQGSTLSRGRAPRGAAEFIAGRALATAIAGGAQPLHDVAADDQSRESAAAGTAGATASPTRASPTNGGLTAADLPRLKLKWAFGYSGVSAARAQPTIAGGRLFVASENGEVHALDPKTGCTHWTFKAQAGVRTALVRRPLQDRVRRPGQAVYFGDARANAYAVDAQTGQPSSGCARWTTIAAAAITGAPAVSRRPRLRAGAGAERGRPGRHAATTSAARSAAASSALDANTGARGVEDLHRRRAQAAREEQGRRADVGPGRRRHLVGADRRRQARRGLRRHRQRLRRSAAAD